MSEKVFTGPGAPMLDALKERISTSDRIDIAVGFLMMSGTRLILPALREAKDRGARIRVLTGTYLDITEPAAMMSLSKELGSSLELRVKRDKSVSFHPKAYILHSEDEGWSMFIGSSNLSSSALSNGVEWNYLLDEITDKASVDAFRREFERLFTLESDPATPGFMTAYAKNRQRPDWRAAVEGEEPNEEEDSPVPTPRESQVEALYALSASREEGADKALVEAATGIGKTYLAAFDSRPYQRVLFVAHREEILAQAERSFNAVRPDSKTGFLTGNRKDLGADILFAGIQTISSPRYLNPDVLPPDRFDYIVVDEFHHAAAASYRRVMDYFRPRFLLGLTATAERLDRQSLEALCDYNVPYRLTLPDAIERGDLAPFHYYGVYDTTVDYSRLHRTNGHYDSDELTRKLSTKDRADLAIKNYRKWNSRRALGFTSSRAHALYMAKAFTDAGHKALAVISGESGDPFQAGRAEAVAKLESGEVKILFSVDIFNEGLDIPDVDLVMFLRPTESPVIFLQQLGRGLRTAPGKDHLTVLDFIGNYDKAFLYPRLLTDREEPEFAASPSATYMPSSLPSGCVIDIDFRLLDLFEEMRRKMTGVRDTAKEIYFRLKADVGHAPSRAEFFTLITPGELEYITSKPQANPFRDYLSFLEEVGDAPTGSFMESEARKFVNVVENTMMTKSYKIPTLLAFVEGDHLKSSVTGEDIAKSFRAFYASGLNLRDMLRDESTKDFDTWDDDKIISLARRNPVKALASSAAKHLTATEDGGLRFSEDLVPWLADKDFAEQFKDAVEYKRLFYSKGKFGS